MLWSYCLSSHTHELCSWPTEIPLTKTQIFNLCGGELKNNPFFSCFNRWSMPTKFENFEQYYCYRLLEIYIFLNYEFNIFYVICTIYTYISWISFFYRWQQEILSVREMNTFVFLCIVSNFVGRFSIENTSDRCEGISNYYLPEDITLLTKPARHGTQSCNVLQN